MIKIKQMKSFFYASLIAILFSSCASTVFTNLQTANGTELKSFPTFLTGAWTGKMDSSGVFAFTENNPIIISNEKMTVNGEGYTLSDSLRLFRNSDFLVLNKISKTYSSSQETLYEVYVLQLNQDSIGNTNNINVHFISAQPMSVSFARNVKRAKTAEPKGTFGIATEGRKITYDLKQSDLNELYHIQPTFALTSEHKIIPGFETEIGYDCGPTPWKIKHKQKRISRILKN